MSGQAVDNTLQLNQSGGGRIDIPLPESEIEVIDVSGKSIAFTGEIISSVNRSNREMSNGIDHILRAKSYFTSVFSPILFYSSSDNTISLTNSSGFLNYDVIESGTVRINEVKNPASLEVLPDGDWDIPILDMSFGYVSLYLNGIHNISYVRIRKEGTNVSFINDIISLSNYCIRYDNDLDIGANADNISSTYCYIKKV